MYLSVRSFYYNLSYKLSYLCDEDRGREDDGEAPDEDQTPSTVGHRAK